ncbi:MAG: hypothetical protein HWD82_01070 [Flavobacteriaceae bacterium]|nr:hypothetical protein [Flavobacteriaceae bacterium]
MKYLTKKRVVLFLLFIFPLICFLILSTGENNFKKLPILTEGVYNLEETLNKPVFNNKVSIICFLGEDVEALKTGIFNLNEKIYKKFLDYNDFQVIGIYPNKNQSNIDELKETVSKYTQNMQKWKFLALDDNTINAFYKSLCVKDSLTNLGIAKAFILDKNLNLRGRINDEDFADGRLEGYNLNSVSELKSKMKDDINVLFYEYYAAFKNRNKNKADRKEVGL